MTIRQQIRTDATASLASAVALYARTSMYHRKLRALPAGGVPQLDQWMSAVGAALSSLERGVAVAAERHEMWPWIAARVGADPVIAGRLLSRLDPSRAESPSSFWKFCGLATVPGVAMRCDRCGRVVHQPLARTLTCGRLSGSPQQRCGGVLVQATDGAPIRVAQRWTGSPVGGRWPYDREARTTAYLLGHDLIARSANYGQMYGQEVIRLRRARPAWSQQHRFRGARRRVTKAFLADLWHAWRVVRGLSTSPHANARV